MAKSKRSRGKTHSQKSTSNSKARRKPGVAQPTRREWEPQHSRRRRRDALRRALNEAVAIARTATHNGKRDVRALKATVGELLKHPGRSRKSVSSPLSNNSAKVPRRAEARRDNYVVQLAGKPTKARRAFGLSDRSSQPHDTEVNSRRERARCKERPQRNKGDGSSRPFIPWCERRR